MNPQQDFTNAQNAARYGENTEIFKQRAKLFNMERKTIEPKKIGDMEQGERVAVVGVVIEKDNSGFLVIEEKEARATILVPQDLVLENIDVGDLARVIGLVMEKEEIKAEIIQKVNGLDLDVYSKYLELHKKFKHG